VHNYSGLFEEQGRARGLVGRHPANALSSLGNKTTAADEPTAKGGRRKRQKVESVSYACIQVDWVRSTRQLPGRGFLRRDVGAFSFLLGGKGISGLFFVPFVGIKGQHARGPGDFSSCLGGVFLGFFFSPSITLHYSF
jgi:hypothetical protein